MLSRFLRPGRLSRACPRKFNFPARRNFGAQATLLTQQEFFKPLSNVTKYREDLINKEDLLENVIFPEIFPLTEDAFGRMDKRPDSKFYAEPRIGVSHVDDSSLSQLVEVHSGWLPQFPDVHLDLCSSWQSHLPEDYKPGEIVGVGMSSAEMEQNPRLTSHFVLDLNEKDVDINLPFTDDSVDCVTCALSVDYLTRPFDVLEEVYRVLKPGGRVLITFSNRCFPTKVIKVWLSSNDIQRVALVSSYFHYGMQWADLQAKDVTPENAEEPLFLVTAIKP